ncbi:MAG TPA: hypothetical protein VMV47_09475 [Bacteroidales bacterium]|nr:hypothetical protein [Bacteroidales bacterium]
MGSNRILIAVVAGLSILMTSCYFNYIHLKYETYTGAGWNKYHTQIAFAASTSAYQKAQGITAFPDGGTHKYLINNAGLYIIDTTKSELTKLVDFSDLYELIRKNWSVEIIFNDTLIYYKIKPSTEWEQYLKWSNNKKDSLEIYTLKDKYLSSYYVNILNRNIVRIDSGSFSIFNKKNSNECKTNLTILNKILSNVQVAEWGLRIKDIYPKPDSKYIDDNVLCG